jgi:large repetitive protein
MRMIRLAAIGAVVVVGGCGSDPYGTNGGACTPTASQVCMGNRTFSPTTRTVSAGVTVTWLNGSGVAHTVTNSPGSGETFDQTVGVGSGVFSHEFNTPGPYEYYCKNHGTPSTGMRGTIVVQ